MDVKKLVRSQSKVLNNTAGVLHNLTPRQVDNLEALFSTLTPEGWATPTWVTALRASITKTE